MHLREKLRLALAAAPVRSAPTQAPLADPVLRPHLPLPVERQETEAGNVWVAEERWPIGYRHGHLALGHALEVGEAALARLAPGLEPADLERAAFVDVETTGLAGGTGTLAFLVGVATFEGGRLCLRQFFLADLSGEEAMLAAVAQALDGCRAVVSFNGRSFDVPLLESRFIMTRLSPPFERLAHVDLLLAARRLYGQRLESCRLSALEEAVLGVRRQRDVPGWAVPRLYFDYLRHGAAQPLADVFRHNRLDVLSLVTLLAYIGQAARAGTPGDPHMCLALARWDEAQGRLAQAAALYRSALDASIGGEGQAFVLPRLVRIYRRLGRWQEMEGLLAKTLERSLPPRCRLEALVALAKLKEHRHRDFVAAQALTREALSLLDVLALRAEQPAGTRKALKCRLLRLQRRAEAASRSRRIRDHAFKQW